MKTNLFSVLITAFLFPQLCAQTFSYGESNELSMGLQSGITNQIGTIGDSYYVIEHSSPITSNPIVHIRQIDINTLLVKQTVNINKILTEKIKTEFAGFGDLIAIKDNIYLFYFKDDKASKNIFFCYAQALDQNLNPVGSPVKVSSITSDYNTKTGLLVSRDGSEFGRGLKVDNRHKFGLAKNFFYTISPDSTKIVFLSNTPIAKGNNYVHFSMFDLLKNEITEHEYEIELKAKVADLTDFKVDNDGSIFFSTLSYSSKSSVTDVNTPSTIEALLHKRYAKTTEKDKSIVLSLNGKRINSLSMDFTLNGKMLLTGVYSNNPTEYINHGIFSFMVNIADLSNLKSNTREYPVDLLKIWFGEKDEKKLNGLDFVIALSKPLIAPDGTAYYFAHRLKLFEYTTPKYTTISEEYRGALFYQIKPNGEIGWIDLTYQESKNYEGYTRVGGFITLLHNNNFVLGYNNRIKGKRGLEYRVYDYDGKMTTKFIPYDKKFDNHSLISSTYIQKEDKHYLLLADLNVMRLVKEFIPMKIIF
jgi:hypothetical protein